MNYMDAYRDRDIVLGLAAQIREMAAGLVAPVTFMEVCGTHTMAIYEYGIRTLLPPQVRLISGPGCPVCVTPNGYMDKAVAYSRLPETIIATFGDMVRVPGSSTSLMEERAKGADIRVVYSPLDAVTLAVKIPQKRSSSWGSVRDDCPDHCRQHSCRRRPRLDQLLRFCCP